MNITDFAGELNAHMHYRRAPYSTSTVQFIVRSLGDKVRNTQRKDKKRNMVAPGRESSFCLTIMRAYYFDNLPGDQRLPHKTERYVDIADLRKLGVLHWTVPQEAPGGWESEIDKIAKQQGYKKSRRDQLYKGGTGGPIRNKAEVVL